MTKKEKEEYKKQIKKWELHTIYITFMHLLDNERQNTCNGSHDTTDGTNQDKCTGDALPTQTPLEPSFVYQDAATAGYLKAMWQLLKQAFFHKKGVHFFLIGYRSISPDL